ncbi:hypothetical protein C8F04DRAFT_375221 [Mycena alexandri]|uniref:Uncharacterized protein n=1 Tax=Mycena alexandri TaxID=1745969 RepID=A0AAD6XAM0_9AGAR|nr:hypothetical protein C8F04DRAFT_375221 [Mycena alexandri]
MLYFCGILGASDPIVDDWMVTDFAVASALVESSSTRAYLFTILPFRSFACCSDDRFKFGDCMADRLEVLVPDDSLVQVNGNGASLKSLFLQRISSITTHMNPADQLLIFIAAHGEEDEGEVLIGEQPFRIPDVAAAIKNNAKTVLWSTACFSGKWLEGDVLWKGYVAAPSNEESDSLVASDSNYNRGGSSMLTTFASLAADQNIILPLPYRSLSDSTRPAHYYEQPTPIKDTTHRSLQDRAGDANEHRKHLSCAYDADTIGDPSTQRPLPVPQLTSEVLKRFTLIRHTASAPTTTPTTVKSGSFRRRMEQLPPIPGLDVQALVEFGVKLLDVQVSSAHLVYLAGRLQKPDLTQEDACVLFSAFNHRRQCQLAVETYLGWVDWRSKKPPQWDFSGAAGALEREMVADDKEAAAWQGFFCWRPKVAGWRNLTWTDIRQQVALAWEGAGKPPFSSTQFLAVASTMDDIKKTDILISSPSMQAIVHLMSGIHHGSTA